jgi:hypothetical protein
VTQGVTVLPSLTPGPRRAWGEKAFSRREKGGDEGRGLAQLRNT